MQRRYEEEQQQQANSDDPSSTTDPQQQQPQQARTPQGVSWEVRKATAADQEPSALVRDAL